MGNSKKRSIRLLEQENNLYKVKESGQMRSCDKYDNKITVHDNKKSRGGFNFRQNAFGVVEVILILVIVVGLVLIFKNEIEEIVQKAISAFTSDANKII